MSDSLPKDLTLAQFHQFRDYIHLHSGIYLEESKLDSLRISLVTRATRLECPDWGVYFDRLTRDHTEFRELMNLVTINETSFFRFPAQFEALRNHVIPEIINASDREDKTLRVWSAGCSTGEEPYSIAMALIDSGIEQMGWRCEVAATDVSTRALEHAQAGVYSARHMVNVPEDTVRRHFVKMGDTSWRVASHVRALVDFGYHNLIKEPYSASLLGTWDIIFCRNVTIYFKIESTKRVVANFYDSLNEGGYLFVGHSETLTTISDQFEPVETGGVFLYRRPRRVRRSPWAAMTARVTHGATAAKPPSRAKAPEPTPPRTERTRPKSAPAAGGRAAARPAPAVAAEESSDDLLSAARMRMSSGDAGAALQAVEILLARDASNAEAHLISAQIYADTGDYERATKGATQALATNPLLAGARYVLGLIHQRQGDTIHAIAEFKKTVYIDPEFALAYLNLGNIYKTQGAYEQACRQYDNALHALRKDPEGRWTQYLGGWKADMVLRTCERSLIECRKALGRA